MPDAHAPDPNAVAGNTGFPATDARRDIDLTRLSRRKVSAGSPCERPKECPRSFASFWASLRPAPEALLPYLRWHCIDVCIREDQAAAAPHAGLPAKADRGECQPARLGVTTKRQRKRKDILC